MSNQLATLKPPRGSRKSPKRAGRGPGSGIGKTAGRGEGGQTSRSGRAKGIRPGFEGGQMPLQRRLPKRGFINRFKKERALVNVRDLNRFESGSVVGPEELIAERLVPAIKDGIKLLAVGELEHPVTVRVHACSAAARVKVEAAGGTVELLNLGQQPAVGEESE